MRSPATRVGYKEILDEFKGFSAVDPEQEIDAELDDKLVQWMNLEFLRGARSWRGERLMAALMAIRSCFSRSGSRKVPRAFRALRGWRVLCPTYSRVPEDWPVWCAMAMELARDSNYLLGLGLLILVDCYLRPNELLQIRPEDLLAPQGARGTWSIILFPQHRPARSKTGTADDTVMLDSPRLRWLSSLLPSLKACGRSRVWPWTYVEFFNMFVAVAKKLDLKLVPYQGRHSGASLDALAKSRTLQDIQKRGRWASHKSVIRYEKTGRIQEAWRHHSARQQEHFLRCEQAVEVVFTTGRGLPAAVVL